MDDEDESWLELSDFEGNELGKVIVEEENSLYRFECYETGNMTWIDICLRKERPRFLCKIFIQ